MRLTKRIIDASEPQSQRYLVMDDELPGFGVRIEPSGSKVYFIRYRANGGGRNAPQRTMTIGKHGPVTPDEARKHARTLLGGVARGDDPAGDRTAKRAEMTVGDLLEVYEAEGCVVQRGIRQGEPMKPMTKRYTMARLRHHVLPLLGRKRVSEIGPGEIERFSADVAGGKTAKVSHTEGKPRSKVIVRGGDGAARKVIRDLSAVLSFARRRGIIVANPVETAAVRKTDGKRTRFLSLAEIEALGRALDELETEGLNPKAANITRLWALTGCRRNEIAALRWPEVEIENGLLRLDDTKTGKNIRPLAAAAIALLSAIPRASSSNYVFPAETGDAHFQGTKRVWPRILQRARLGSDVTPHVLRHSLGSIAASSGEALLIVGALLGHANARSTSIYAHIAHDPARSAADRAAGAVAAAMSGRGKPTETTDNG